MEMNQRKAEMEEKGKSQSVIEKLKNDIRLKEMEFEDQVLLLFLNNHCFQYNPQLISCYSCIGKSIETSW